MEPVTFFDPRERPYGCFSNFSRHQIYIDDCCFPTVEHYFQSQKFAVTEPAYADLIWRAATPRIAAGLGRAEGHRILPGWDVVQDALMRYAVLLKFATHASPRRALLSTRGRDVVEASPTDHYWGGGEDGTGRNMLGHILMEVRTVLPDARGLESYVRQHFPVLGRRPDAVVDEIRSLLRT